MNREIPYAIFSYVHHNQQCAALVTLEAETDFCLRTELVQEFGKKLAMHAAVSCGINPKEKWLFDDSKIIEEVLKEISDQLKEKLKIIQVSHHRFMGHYSGNCK